MTDTIKSLHLSERQRKVIIHEFSMTVQSIAMNLSQESSKLSDRSISNEDFHQRLETVATLDKDIGQLINIILVIKTSLE